MWGRRAIRLERGDRRDVEDVIGGRAAREIATRPAQPLNDRTDGCGAAESLHQFVRDVPRIQGWEDEHVRPTRDGTARSLAHSDVAHERRITLQFSVHRKTRHSAPYLGQCVRDSLDARARGTAFRAERQERDGGHVAHDTSTVFSRRDRDVGELRCRRVWNDGAVRERQHLAQGDAPHGLRDHVEGTRDGAHAGRGADQPERGTEDVCGRVGCARDTGVDLAARDHRVREIEWCSRQLVRPLVRESLRTARREQLRRRLVRSRVALDVEDLHAISGQRASRGVGVGPCRIQNEHRGDDALPGELGDRTQRPFVSTLGKGDTSSRRARPNAHLVQKAHAGRDCGGYFWRRAAATAGCTRSPISPPNRATSRTRLALMYVVSSDGTMKTVSRPADRWRFMRAIWYSYSKSLTARSPRINTFAPTSRAKSTSSPLNWRTSTRALLFTAARINSTRSPAVNRGCFDTLVATATTSLSTNSRLRETRSSCPRVIGSKLPA